MPDWLKQVGYTPGQQPDPEFIKFFAGPWQELLEIAEIPGMAEPSWDRRAAYLYWVTVREFQGHKDICEALLSPPDPEPEVGFQFSFDATLFTLG